MEDMRVKEIVEATGGRLLCGDENRPVCHICIDSRAVAAGDLFVPLVGEKVDAHRFLPQVTAQGAAAVLTSEHDQAEGETAWIRVKDTKQALQDLGACYRNRLALPLVGITGSVGKTTTREMVATALSAGFQVFKTAGNLNSQVGVPMTLTELTKADQIGVIELGMSEPGELSVIARIARVNMAVITNIGITHIEQLGSQENIYREKLCIQDGMAEDGILFLNGDDPYLKETKARDGRRTIYYGTGEHCDYRAVDITVKQGFPVFTAVHEDQAVPVSLQVMGSHNILNAMASLAVAAENGVSMEAAAKALASYTGFQGRQQIRHVKGMTVIDDTYNASPVSMKAGVEVLCSMAEEGRKIAVLADMKELGPDTVRFHQEVGSFIGERSLDAVFLLGDLAVGIGTGIREKNLDTELFYFSDRQQLTQALSDYLQSGDHVLLKGSNSMKLGEVAASICKEQETGETIGV
ncbi:MAG: UDP-N-acetylmuramoyl-tripeptide--D-alanyl-D-alanine ligase [Lachnospiraceae bacterium]